MPPEVFVGAGCHCGAVIRSNLRSFDVDQACTPIAGAAQSNELLNAAREAVAAAVVFKNLRRGVGSNFGLLCGFLKILVGLGWKRAKGEIGKGHVLNPGTIQTPMPAS